MSSDELIRTLTIDLAPVPRLPSIGARVARWSVAAVGVVGFGVAALGPRPRLFESLHGAGFVGELALLAFVFVLAARGAFRTSVPGVDGRMFTRAFPIVGLFAWLVWIVLRDGVSSHAASFAGVSCVGRMIALSVVPAVAILSMLRRAAPLDRGWTGSLALLAAGSIGIAGTELLCAADDRAHVLVWHFLPVLVATLAGIGLGRRLLARQVTDPRARS